MNTNHLPPPWIIALLIGIMLTGAVLIYTMPPLEPIPPDYNVLVWHSNPDLLHLSGKYRVIVYDQSGNYLGYLHLSRTEMGKPIKILVDYQFEEFGKEYSDAKISTK